MKRASAMLCTVLAAVLTLAACSSRPVRAPVLERVPLPAAVPAAPLPAAIAAAAPGTDARPDTYTVRRGDTLYSIALDHGLDYKELAAWNNLENPGVLSPGRQLRIKPPAGVQEAPVTVHPVTSSERVETHSLGAPAPARAVPAARPPGTEEQVKSEPLARKLPYSPENVALLQRSEAPAKPPPGPAVLAPSLAPAPALPPVPAPAAVPKQEPAPGAAPKQEPAPAATPKQEPGGKTDADIGDEDKVEWGWPTQGKILAGFSEASNKGLDIGGKPGDPVIASAPGRVVYSGSGLRGYGKLVIIKHNKTYLSAYAHNKDIFVKEGQSVLKGQKIAEIGSTDTDVPKLHFEIRKLGKPVDPAKYLPPS